MEDSNHKPNKQGDLFSKAVKAGKRTYFFDLRKIKGDDYFLTITESKKMFSDDGKFHFEKHKIFLYKEDFEKFAEGMNEVFDFSKDVKKHLAAAIMEETPAGDCIDAPVGEIEVSGPQAEEEII